jgi:hypothetical protein
MLSVFVTSVAILRIIMVIDVILSVFMLRFDTLCVIKLSIIELSVVKLGVVVLTVMAPQRETSKTVRLNLI